MGGRGTRITCSIHTHTHTYTHFSLSLSLSLLLQPGKAREAPKHPSCLIPRVREEFPVVLGEEQLKGLRQAEGRRVARLLELVVREVHAVLGINAHAPAEGEPPRVGVARAAVLHARVVLAFRGRLLQPDVPVRRHVARVELGVIVHPCIDKSHRAVPVVYALPVLRHRMVSPRQLVVVWAGEGCR